MFTLFPSISSLLCMRPKSTCFSCVSYTLILPFHKHGIPVSWQHLHFFAAHTVAVYRNSTILCKKKNIFLFHTCVFLFHLCVCVCVCELNFFLPVYIDSYIGVHACTWVRYIYSCLYSCVQTLTRCKWISAFHFVTVYVWYEPHEWIVEFPVL